MPFDTPPDLPSKWQKSDVTHGWTDLQLLQDLRPFYPEEPGSAEDGFF